MVDVVLMEWALSPLGPPLLEKLRALLPMVPSKTSLLPLPPVEFTTAGRGEGLISAHIPAILPPVHLPDTAAPPPLLALNPFSTKAPSLKETPYSSRVIPRVSKPFLAGFPLLSPLHSCSEPLSWVDMSSMEPVRTVCGRGSSQLHKPGLLGQSTML